MKAARVLTAPFFALLSVLCFSPCVSAATAREVDASVEAAIEKLKSEVSGAPAVLKDAAGILVFPGIWKGGIGLGGEYGEGALLSGGKVLDYYSVAGGSFGFQLGLQKQALVLVFLDETTLNRFRQGDGWEFGLDGSAVLVKIGLDGSINSITSNEAVLTFVPTQKGLMYNLTGEVYKLTKIRK